MSTLKNYPKNKEKIHICLILLTIGKAGLNTSTLRPKAGKCSLFPANSSTHVSQVQAHIPNISQQKQCSLCVSAAEHRPLSWEVLH